MEAYALLARDRRRLRADRDDVFARGPQHTGVPDPPHGGADASPRDPLSVGGASLRNERAWPLGPVGGAGGDLCGL